MTTGFFCGSWIRSKRKLTGRTMSKNQGQSRVRFINNTASNRPAGSQKLTKAPPPADKWLPTSAHKNQAAPNHTARCHKENAVPPGRQPPAVWIIFADDIMEKPDQACYRTSCRQDQQKFGKEPELLTKPA